jgi:hypothetical protein
VFSDNLASFKYAKSADPTASSRVRMGFPIDRLHPPPEPMLFPPAQLLLLLLKGPAAHPTRPACARLSTQQGPGGRAALLLAQPHTTPDLSLCPDQLTCACHCTTHPWRRPRPRPRPRAWRSVMHQLTRCDCMLILTNVPAHPCTVCPTKSSQHPPPKPRHPTRCPTCAALRSVSFLGFSATVVTRAV